MVFHSRSSTAGALVKAQPQSPFARSTSAPRLSLGTPAPGSLTPTLAGPPAGCRPKPSSQAVAPSLAVDFVAVDVSCHGGGILARGAYTSRPHVRSRRNTFFSTPPLTSAAALTGRRHRMSVPSGLTSSRPGHPCPERSWWVRNLCRLGIELKPTIPFRTRVG
jgi:hypothetical protein